MTGLDEHVTPRGNWKEPFTGYWLLDRSARAREHQAPIDPVRKVAVTYLTINVLVEQPRRLCVTGEIDFASADELRAALEPPCNDKTDLVLDFDHVTFLDSSGISALVTASAAVSPGRLIVHGARPGVRMALDVVGLSVLCD